MIQKRLLAGLVFMMLLSILPSCSILDFKKVYEFDLIFKVDSENTTVNEIYFVDSTVYHNILKYVDYVETIEVDSITCSLISFKGSDEQTLSNGRLTVSDEKRSESVVITTIPKVFLHELFNKGRKLDMDEEGISLVEDLILNYPHKCQGRFIGDVNSAPADFTINFHVVLTVTGDLLTN